MSQEEAVMVHGVCPKCGHICEGFVTLQQMVAKKPIICCGGSDSKKSACGEKITEYERVP